MEESLHGFICCERQQLVFPDQAQKLVEPFRLSFIGGCGMLDYFLQAKKRKKKKN
jgi:hypothetical protein